MNRPPTYWGNEESKGNEPGQLCTFPTGPYTKDRHLTHTETGRVDYQTMQDGTHKKQQPLQLELGSWRMGTLLKLETICDKNPLRDDKAGNQMTTL